MTKQDLISLIALIIAALALVTSQLPPLYEFFKKPYIELDRMDDGLNFYICSSLSDLYILKHIRVSNTGTGTGHLRNFELTFNNGNSFYEFQADLTTNSLDSSLQLRQQDMEMVEEVFLEQSHAWQKWILYRPSPLLKENILQEKQFNLRKFSLLEIVTEGDHGRQTITNGFDNLSYNGDNILNIKSPQIECKEVKAHSITVKDIETLLKKRQQRKGSKV